MPAAGTVLPVGQAQLLTVNVAPTTNYNAASDSVAINVDSAVDLVVQSVTPPPAAPALTAGQTVVVSWTDANTGTATANGPWVDTVYLATDPQGDNLTTLGNFPFTGALAAGASIVRTQQVVLPQTAGTYWFTVTTNSTHAVSEPSGFGNNTTVAGSSTVVNPILLPDLVVTSLTPPPNGVFSGTSVPISFIVKNQGPSATSVPVWQDWVILSQDPTLAQTYQGQLNGTGPGGDQTLNNQPIIQGFQNPSFLAPGQSYQQNVNVTLPITAQGIWYVYVVPDGTGLHHPFAMPEVSRTDKLAMSSGFTVTLSPFADLAVTSVQAPAENFSGQSTTVKWTVANQGTARTSVTSWDDEVYMSPDPTFDSNARALGAFPHNGALGVGASYTQSEAVTLPVGVSGPFYFLVQTDVNGAVFQDGSTANDVAATPAAVTVNLIAATRPVGRTVRGPRRRLGRPWHHVHLRHLEHRRRRDAEQRLGGQLLPLAHAGFQREHGNSDRAAKPGRIPVRRHQRVEHGHRDDPQRRQWRLLRPGERRQPERRFRAEQDE